MSKCPSDSDLTRLRSDDLTTSQREQILDHISQCSACTGRTSSGETFGGGPVELSETIPWPISRFANAANRPPGQPQQPVGDAEAQTIAPAIEGYHIVGEPHRGGQGIVFPALQESTKRQVAIKVLLAGAYASPSVRRRFEREIELVAALRHPHIVAVFDSGLMSDGRQYCIMDYVKGQTLTRHVRGRRHTVRDVLLLFQKVCDAVNHAHQRGVIHRDLKPSNILVDEAGSPKVLDFGLAKVVDNPSQSMVSLTGNIVGTVPYMSPEQTRGQPADIDVRTDVYALGVVLYELLTGTYPYPVDGHFTEVARHINETPPTPPSRAWNGKSGVAHRKADTAASRTCPIDHDVQTIALKCLAKEPQRRYQSAGDLLQDIGLYLEGKPIRAKADSRWYVARKFVQRHRAMVGATVLVFALSIAASAVTWTLYTREQNAREAAEASDQRNQKLLAESNVNEAELAAQRGEWDRAVELYNQALDLGVENEIEVRLDLISALDALNREADALQEINAMLQAGPGKYEGTLRLWLGDLNLNVDRESALREIATAIELGMPPGDEAYARGLTAESLDEAVDQFERIRLEDPFHHRAVGMLALSYIFQGERRKAKDHLFAELARSPDSPALLSMYVIVSAFDGDFAAANEAIDQMKPLAGEGQAEALRAMIGLLAQVNQNLANWNPMENMLESFGPMVFQAAVIVGSAPAQEPGSNGDLGLTAEDLLRMLPPPALAWWNDLVSAFHSVVAGDCPSAVASLEKARRYNNDGMTEMFYAKTLARCGQTEQAIAAFATAAELPSMLNIRRAASFSAVHEAFEASKWEGPRVSPEDGPRMRELLRQYVNAGPVPIGLVNHMIDIALWSDDDVLAQWLADDWRRREPDNVEAIAKQAQAQFVIADYVSALHTAAEVLALNPKHEQAHQIFEDARKAIADQIVGHPLSSTPRLNLSDYLKQEDATPPQE